MTEYDSTFLLIIIPRKAGNTNNFLTVYIRSVKHYLEAEDVLTLGVNFTTQISTVVKARISRML